MQDGWFDLICNLSEEIEAIYYREFTGSNITHIPIVSYAKSKFGFLRFVMYGYNNDEVKQAIKKAQEIAIHTCARCSKPGKHKIMSSGYEVIYCDRCEKAYENELY